MITRVILLGFLLFTVLETTLPTNSCAISLDDEEEDLEDVEDLLLEAKKAGRTQSFHKAEALLKKAQMYGTESEEIEEVEAYISKRKKAYHTRIERERQEREREARLQREREVQSRMAQSSLNSEGDLRRRCAVVIGDNAAYWACTKNIGALQGLGTNNGMKAIYAIRGQCNYLSGIDNRGLSYLCSNPNSNGCIGLQASQNTINACYNCGGSNLWLRVYATGTVLQCY